MPDTALQASIVSERMLLQDSPGGTCVNKMRAVFMLRRSLGTGSSFGNASAIQKTVRCETCLRQPAFSDMSQARRRSTACWILGRIYSRLLECRHYSHSALIDHDRAAKQNCRLRLV